VIGDFFESVSASVYIMRRTAGLLMAHDVKVYMVYGQHDLRYHASDTSNVPLQLFEDFNLVERLHPTGGTLLSPLTEKKKVVGWGSSWNEEIPDTMDPKDINIWATHRMVIDNEKLWDGMKDYTLAKHLLRKNPFALIITGDNHRSFTTKYGIRWLINCGSLGRTNIDQAAHIPHFMIFDTETRKLAKIKVPIRPPKEVLKIEEAKERKRKEAELAELIKGMESATKVQKRVNYKEMVFNVLKKTDDVALSHMMEKIFIAAGSKAMKLELDEEVTI
jgi:DNA repair exonuclease SbcCD nuclease subunit